MTVRAIFYELLTQRIGDELARMIREGATDLGLQLCQFGGANRIANVKRMSDVIPAVIVGPELVTPLAIGVAQRHHEVQDDFRITYAFRINPDSNLETDMVDGARSLIRALRQDIHLDNLKESIRPHSIVSSLPRETDWQPDEDTVMADEEIPVKIIAQLWRVKWITRG